jgi:hypothetical protein
MILGSQWLLELAKLGENQSKVARQLIRLQALSYNRLRHEPELDTEYVRRRVVSSARWGHLADVTIYCRICGCQASLSYWYRGLTLPDSERLALLADRRLKEAPEWTAYLRPCPGAEYAEDIARTESLPSTRRP